jgi:hypothetical protein
MWVLSGESRTTSGENVRETRFRSGESRTTRGKNVREMWFRSGESRTTRGKNVRETRFRSGESRTTRGESPRRLDPPRLVALLSRAVGKPTALPAVLTGEPSLARLLARPPVSPCLRRRGGIETPAPFSPTRVCESARNSRWTSRFQRRAYLRPSARAELAPAHSTGACDASYGGHSTVAVRLRLASS